MIAARRSWVFWGNVTFFMSFLFIISYYFVLLFKKHIIVLNILFLVFSLLCLYVNTVWGKKDLHEVHEYWFPRMN